MVTRELFETPRELARPLNLRLGQLIGAFLVCSVASWLLMMPIYVAAVIIAVSDVPLEIVPLWTLVIGQILAGTLAFTVFFMTMLRR